MSKHHDKFPPSSLPALEQCPQYQTGGGDEEAMENGTRQHSMLAALCAGKYADADYADLSAENRESVEWAFSRILELTNSARLVEQHIDVPLGFEVVTWGTSDCIQPPLHSGDPVIVLDYKRGRPGKPYDAQLLAYAVGAMVRYGATRAECWLLYGAARCKVRYEFALPEAEARLASIIDRVNSNAPARPCEFCEWCGTQKTCAALSGEVVQVVAGYEETPPFALENYHASQITQPEQMAMALELSKRVEAWAAAVQHHAKEAAAGGMVIPGWRLTAEGEKQFIADVDLPAAFTASGMTAAEFLSACTVSIPALRDIIAPALGFKTGNGKKVKEELSRRLGALIQTKPTAPKLERDR